MSAIKLDIEGYPLELDSPKIMGVLGIHPNTEETIDDYVERVLSMQEYGAEFVEVGVITDVELSTETELALLVPVLKAVVDKASAFIAVSTSNPKVMEEAVSLGAHLIIDPNALRKDGAVETIAKLKVPVCLVYDCDKNFDTLDSVDPMASVSEFLYERIDACLNAGIERRSIIIDPSVGLNTPLEYRLKMLGRLNTFKSFALPISVAIPRSIPYEDQFLKANMAAAVAICLFSIESGVNIIRTTNVSDMALAIDT